jgi:hypothetical protein
MPNKIAEAQLFHAAERESLVSITLPVNGDPLDPDQLDNFAYEVHAAFRHRRQSGERMPAVVPDAAESPSRRQTS